LKPEHSRGLRLAARASGADETTLSRRLNQAEVTVSADVAISGVDLTLEVLVTTLRRQPYRLYLDDDGLPGDLVDHLREACENIDPSRPLQVGRSSRGSTVHLGEHGLAPVRVLPDGYGARLVRHGSIGPEREANALGSVYAAALAAGEIFKMAAEVTPTRQVRHERLAFCPVSLSDDLGAAPTLTATVLDAALVGLGAVGTATALILGHLPFTGRLTLIDPESFAAENLGTYSLGARADAQAGRAKVDLAAAALSQFETTLFAGPVEDAIRAVDAGTVRWPRQVLSGLDSIAARYGSQLLWPDVLIDAATGDTAVGIHDASHGEPCLMCFFPPPEQAASATTQLMAATGFARETLAAGDHLIDERDIERIADASKRKRARALLGTAVCGLASAIGLTADGDDTYQPAVPFVSQQAACLGVGRLIARLLNVSHDQNFVQYDALRGPQSMTVERREPRANCYSVLNHEIIAAVRQHRRSKD